MADLEFKGCSRDWEKFNNDEIFAIWKGYLRTEFPYVMDSPLRHCSVKDKPIRLTPLEIIKLVEELMDRLEIKDSK